MHELAHQTFQEARQGRSGCLFCRPFEGMKIFDTAHFRVLADTFPVHSGHVMISSKDHWGCAGEVPSDLQVELSNLKDSVREIVQGLNGRAVFYEHGRAGCCLALDANGQKCEHFHLHCVPADIDIRKPLDQRFEQITLGKYSQIHDAFMEEGNYLYFEDADGQMSFYPAADQNVEPHLLRTLVCQALGVPQLSEWERCRDPELFRNSLDLIHQLVQAQEGHYELLG